MSNLPMESKISIRPYVKEDSENMGLSKYNMSVFENIFQEEPIICLENRNGVKRYLTGLNEFAPELKELDEKTRESKIREIRNIVSQIEKELGGNVIDPEDEKFWEKVKFISPTNYEFWEKIEIKVGNDPVYLHPQTDINDLIKLKAIESGGFSLVAPSLEIAKKVGTYKFYLDKYQETAGIKTEIKKLRNKSLAALQNLFDKNTNKLFYVCKLIDGNSSQYKKSTPNDIMYDNMDSYINGETVEKNKKKTAQRFLEIVELDMETLKIRSIIKDSHFYKIIINRADGYIYHAKTNSLLGKNVSDIIEYLKNPLNEEILIDMTKSVEKYWNN